MGGAGRASAMELVTTPMNSEIMSSLGGHHAQHTERRPAAGVRRRNSEHPEPCGVTCCLAHFDACCLAREAQLRRPCPLLAFLAKASLHYFVF